MNQKPKCIWTGNDDPRVIPVKLQTLDRFSIPTEKTFYVLTEYEQKLRDFNKRLVKHGRLFLILIIGLSLLLPINVLVLTIFSFSDSIILLSVGIITTLMGIVIILFPFPTPETAKWLGLKRAILLARCAGFLTIVLGNAIRFLPSL